jgi:hypothetical protein
MGALDDMAQQARLIAAKLKVSIPKREKVFRQRRDQLQTQFETQLALYIDNYKKNNDVSDAARTSLESISSSVDELVNDIQAASKDIDAQVAGVDGMISGLHTTITNIQKTTDFDSLDASSKQLLMDLSKDYKVSYAILWAKAALVLFLCWYLRHEWILILVAYGAVYIVWLLVDAILKLFEVIFKKKPTSDLEAARCAQVTEADKIGSGCPLTDSPSYKPCSDTEFGCCPNGLAATTDTSTCGTFDCWKTAFGCCPSGKPKESATDSCDMPPKCKSSRFGCCQNGMPREDEEGTNCTLNSVCGYSAFGCCPDGELRTDRLGSNCKTGKASSSPLRQLNDTVSSSTSMNVPETASSIDPPNPFTASNGSANASFTSGLNAVLP